MNSSSSRISSGAESDSATSTSALLDQMLPSTEFCIVKEKGLSKTSAPVTRSCDEEFVTTTSTTIAAW